MHKKEYIIPLFIPFYGCPHDCAFCNQRKITNKNENLSLEDIDLEVSKYLKFFSTNQIKKQVAFFGGSFTGIDRKRMISYLKTAHKYIEKGLIDSIRISTRPDYIDEDILEILKRYDVETIELGIQSLDDEILKLNGRGHTVKQAVTASKLIKKYRFTLGHQIMPGLIGDTFEKSYRTVLDSIKLNPDIVRIYPTLVIKQTLLESLYLKGKYHPLDLNEAIKICSVLYALYELNDINVIRIGLQPTENINYGKDVVTGPFHPAIRQLVEAELYRKILERLIIDYNIKGTVTIGAPDSEISNIVSIKKANTRYFYENYKIQFKFITSSDLFLQSEDIYFKIDRKKELEKLISMGELIAFRENSLKRI